MAYRAQQAVGIFAACSVMAVIGIAVSYPPFADVTTKPQFSDQELEWIGNCALVSPVDTCEKRVLLLRDLGYFTGFSLDKIEQEMH